MRLTDGNLIDMANKAAPHQDRDNDMFYIAMGRLVEEHYINANHGEPVALPARKGTHLRYDTLMPTFSKGWNACLDEITKLGPLYPAPADPGEVERLRASLESATHNVNEMQDQFEACKADNDTLRAQLAELEALHGGELGLPKEGWPEYHKRKMETLRELTAGHYERKLAERDALLRELADAPPAAMEFRLQQKVKAALSVSAEPSAPKET